ncbi:MAG TPA: hypothetical protein VFW03_09140 [Gemmatimonadaceae bacterium]|nr:hypothetical protein [Gemmatimonadaceae bacterium]
MTSERLTAIRRRWEGHSTFDYERDINYLLALSEDAGYLADAAIHATDHMAQEKFYCEDADNLRHFAAKIRARLASPEPRGATDDQ